MSSYILDSVKKALSTLLTPRKQPATEKRVAYSTDEHRPHYIPPIQAQPPVPVTNRRRAVYDELGVFFAEKEAQGRPVTHEEYNQVLLLLAEAVRESKDSDELLRVLEEAKKGNIPFIGNGRLQYVPPFLAKKPLTSTLRRPFIMGQARKRPIVLVEDGEPPAAAYPSNSIPYVPKYETNAVSTEEEPRPVSIPKPHNSFCGRFFYDDDKKEYNTFTKQQHVTADFDARRKAMPLLSVRMASGAASLLQNVQPEPLCNVKADATAPIVQPIQLPRPADISLPPVSVVLPQSRFDLGEDLKPKLENPDDFIPTEMFTEKSTATEKLSKEEHITVEKSVIPVPSFMPTAAVEKRHLGVKEQMPVIDARSPVFGDSAQKPTFSFGADAFKEKPLSFDSSKHMFSIDKSKVNEPPKTAALAVDPSMPTFSFGQLTEKSDVSKWVPIGEAKQFSFGESKIPQFSFGDAANGSKQAAFGIPQFSFGDAGKASGSEAKSSSFGFGNVIESKPAIESKPLHFGFGASAESKAPSLGESKPFSFGDSKPPTFGDSKPPSFGFDANTTASTKPFSFSTFAQPAAASKPAVPFSFGDAKPSPSHLFSFGGAGQPNEPKHFSSTSEITDQEKRPHFAPSSPEHLFISDHGSNIVASSSGNKPSTSSMASRKKSVPFKKFQ